MTQTIFLVFCGVGNRTPHHHAALSPHGPASVDPFEPSIKTNTVNLGVTILESFLYKPKKMQTYLYIYRPNLVQKSINLMKLVGVNPTLMPRRFASSATHQTCALRWKNRLVYRCTSFLVEF